MCKQRVRKFDSAHCLILVLHGSFHHHTQLFLKRPVGTLESFLSILHRRTLSGPLFPTGSCCAPASNNTHAQLRKSGSKNIIMRKMEKNCNGGTKQELQDCSFTEEREKRNLYRLALCCGNVNMHAATCKWQ